MRSGVKAADRELPAESNLSVNTIALILSNGLVCVAGVFFWGAAARMLPASDVGVAAAQITSALMLSTLAILGVDRFYERFLPVAGDRAGTLLRQGFLLVAVMSLLAGIVLVLVGPRHELFKTGWSMVGYPVLVMVIAIFVLQDKAFTGLGVARWVAVKNPLHAVAKLVLLIVLAKTAAMGAVTVAWGVTAAVIAVGVFVALDRRCRRVPRFRVPAALPPWKEIWSYFGASFGITALLSIGALVVPLIVIAQIGPVANAHFQIAWQLIGALYLTVHFVVSPFVAEVAAHPDKVAALSWRMMRMLMLVAGTGAAGLLIAGPIMLSVIGAEYREGGAGLLQLAAVFIPLSVIGAAYEGFARVQRKLRLQLAVTLCATAIVITGSLIGTRHLGVEGVGWAYIAAEGFSACVLIGPVVVWLRRRMHLGLPNEIGLTDAPDGMPAVRTDVPSLDPIFLSDVALLPGAERDRVPAEAVPALPRVGSD